ncbi:hypothetical protein [Lewinella sp. 4G2]|uniref:hypothetical protein n=1 Tax=Lewinella sp. 4G2 TaxID=1803372 RepID=UPI0007B47423|nr:hypothetical protein [Lewinella sp. 4G2]OAV43497.1 hypothetical protein A3850_002850 [Lewinella sp. 4G2]
MRYLLVLTAFYTLCLSSCQRQPAYVANDFDDRTAEHRVIAVIPAEVLYTGRMPRDWSEEQEDVTRREEATLLQRTIQSALLNRANSYRQGLRINFQSINTTNNQLREAGIEPHLAHLEAPEFLTAALGVDAIVITSITKERFISDEASATISVVGAVLNNAGGPLPGAIANRGARTYSVGVVASLVDADGIVLYGDEADINIDWQTTANESVERVARWVSRGFPYRIR